MEHKWLRTIYWVTTSLLIFAGMIPAFSYGKEKKLTYEQVYLDAKPRLLRPVPQIISWHDSEHYLLNDEEANKIYRVHAQTGEKAIYLDYTLIQKEYPEWFNAASAFSWNNDYTRFTYTIKDDVYYCSIEEKISKRLTTTKEEEKNPRLSPDGQLVAFTRENNLYAIDIEKETEYQLTVDGSETIYNGWASWVYYEEILGRSSRYAAFWWSPDSKKLAFLRFDDSPVPTFPLFRSGGAHGELEIERYPKAGDPNPYVKLGIVSATGGQIVWTDIEEKADHYIAWPFWFTDSSLLTFQWMNREQDHIKIYTVDPNDGKINPIYEEKQPAWVEFFADLYFLKNGSGFLLRSNVDGWDHLYFLDLSGKLINQLTNGEWTVSSIVHVDEKNSRVFFLSRKDMSTETHLFVVNLDGSDLNRLTSSPGFHRASISPDGKYIMDTYSNAATPTRRELLGSDGKKIRDVSQSQEEIMKDYKLPKKELITVPTGDGWNLPGYWILPPGFDMNKTYPVLFTIYSGPGSSSVTNTYPPLSSLYLAQEGIIVFSVDHRGSGHFGKKGVALMHRNLGKWEMHDLIEAVKWLCEKPFVDKTKIGITGGSYGGYTTCLALTYGADYFTHGYANYSVTDWRLYDSVYTERYMDRPFENEDGYAFGSVFTHAEKLKDVLFLTHGDMDDNVHMQNTTQLVSKLIDHKKKFQLMIYPDQRHGYRIGKKREHANRNSVDFWFKHFLNR